MTWEEVGREAGDRPGREQAFQHAAAKWAANTGKVQLRFGAKSGNGGFISTGKDEIASSPAAASLTTARMAHMRHSLPNTYFDI